MLVNKKEINSYSDEFNYLRRFRKEEKEIEIENIFKIIKIRKRMKMCEIYDKLATSIEEKLQKAQRELKDIWNTTKAEFNANRNSFLKTSLVTNTTSTGTSADNNQNNINIRFIQQVSNNIPDLENLSARPEFDIDKNILKDLDAYDIFFSYNPIAKREVLDDMINQDENCDNNYSSYPSNLNINQQNDRDIIKTDCVNTNTLLLPSSSLDKSLDNSLRRRKRCKYQMFDSSFKDLCLQLLSKGRTIEEVSKEMNVPRKSLKRWKECGAERKKGCGRKIKDPEMEAKLIKWIEQRMAQGKAVYPRMVKEKALEFTKCDKNEFFASKGWLEKLKKKYNLHLTQRVRNNITEE